MSEEQRYMTLEELFQFYENNKFMMSLKTPIKVENDFTFLAELTNNTETNKLEIKIDFFNMNFYNYHPVDDLYQMPARPIRSGYLQNSCLLSFDYTEKFERIKNTVLNRIMMEMQFWMATLDEFEQLMKIHRVDLEEFNQRMFDLSMKNLNEALDKNEITEEVFQEEFEIIKRRFKREDTQ